LNVYESGQGKGRRSGSPLYCVIYEQEFLGFSYGFRPERGQHDALDALAFGITRTKVNYIVDCDVRAFFDSVSHEWLVRFLEHRIGDPRVIRLIRNWLKAGVVEDGEWASGTADRGGASMCCSSSAVCAVPTSVTASVWPCVIISCRGASYAANRSTVIGVLVKTLAS